MSFTTDYYSNNYPVELLSLATKPANDFQVWYEWKFCYTIIHACNDAIANLHKADMSANKLARYQCEARFLPCLGVQSSEYALSGCSRLSGTHQ